MYGLFPVAYPIAKLLDLLLGANHGLLFNREGLKMLIMLHERSQFSLTERLSREEVTVISTILDLKDKPISSIMTPLANLFTLSNETFINEMTRYNILASGYTIIPIYQQGHLRSFVGVLSVKSLAALKFGEEITVGQLSLDILPVVRPEASCQELFHIFRDQNIKMVLVTERGSRRGEPLGIVSARDVMTEVFGE
jgi:metal transporter CNNM